MLKIYFIVATLLFIMEPACADCTGKSLTNEVKEKFVAELSSDWDNFQVCEIYSKNDDKRAFVEHSFGKKYISEVNILDCKEILIQNQGTSSGLHLGIIALGYPDEKIAIKNYKLVTSNDSKFLANTIILTGYTALRRSNIVVLLYSETFLDEKIKSFFKQILTK
ncbi:MAG: hypothetical protein DRI57_10635 [Deltaproteobacteria bacterium]|nr:MAG: hypothetical protein DRI57_10635 [Deltaproteobacteria bacterium]